MSYGTCSCTFAPMVPYLTGRSSAGRVAPPAPTERVDCRGESATAGQQEILRQLTLSRALSLVGMLTCLKQPNLPNRAIGLGSDIGVGKEDRESVTEGDRLDDVGGKNNLGEAEEPSSERVCA